MNKHFKRYLTVVGMMAVEAMVKKTAEKLSEKSGIKADDLEHDLIPGFKVKGNKNIFFDIEAIKTHVSNKKISINDISVVVVRLLDEKMEKTKFRRVDPIEIKAKFKLDPTVLNDEANLLLSYSEMTKDALTHDEKSVNDNADAHRNATNNLASLLSESVAQTSETSTLNTVPVSTHSPLTVDNPEQSPFTSLEIKTKETPKSNEDLISDGVIELKIDENVKDTKSENQQPSVSLDDISDEEINRSELGDKEIPESNEVNEGGEDEKGIISSLNDKSKSTMGKFVGEISDYRDIVDGLKRGVKIRLIAEKCNMSRDFISEEEHGLSTGTEQYGRNNSYRNNRSNVSNEPEILELLHIYQNGKFIDTIGKTELLNFMKLISTQGKIIIEEIKSIDTIKNEYQPKKRWT